MIISNFIWNLFQEIISHSDNSPTKFSVILYAYFQMLYNFSTLFQQNSVVSNDRTTPLKMRNQIKKIIAIYPKSMLNDVLGTYLYIGHNAFLEKIYTDVVILNPLDYEVKLIKIQPNIITSLKEYSRSHLLGKTLELTRAGFATKNTTGLPADYTGTNIIPSSDNSWQQLIVPTGAVKGTNNLPLIVQTNPLSFKIQNFLGIEFYKNMGFAVDPTKNIINLESKISTTWQNGLKNQIDLLLNVYKDLDDQKKIIAEFFAGSSKNALPPPGFFICIAMQLSQKYKQSIMNDIKMYFSLACGLFDAGVSAWYYKYTYNQGRPISLIRNYYADEKIITWTPLKPREKSSQIHGKQWLPYQHFNFVTPPFPDVASGHTTFSTVAAKILTWWFNNPTLYDGCSIATIPNQEILCPSLNISNKTVSIGEYIFDKGSSTIEPGVVPTEKIILRYNTLQELADMAGLSRIYGGIHTFQTNEVSAELGEWVYQKTREKLMTVFNFKSSPRTLQSGRKMKKVKVKGKKHLNYK
jgi:hypothetical protein